MSINLSGRVPVVVNAISNRLIYLAVAVAVVFVCFVIYGFKYRIQKKEAMKEAATTQVTASDAATSTRETQHPADAALTPVATLNSAGQPNANAPGTGANSAIDTAAGQFRGAITTVAHPFPDGANQYGQSPLPPAYNQTPAFAYNPTPQPDPVSTIKAQMAARELEHRQAVIEAPTGITASSPGTTSVVDPIQSDLARIAALSSPQSNAMPAAAAPAFQGGSAGVGPMVIDDPNGQGQKRAFQGETSPGVSQARSVRDDDGDYLKTSRVAPVSPWVIEKGDKITAGLPDKIVSDLPGDIVAEVKRDVYDSPTHRYVLIPAGSLLGGEYNSSVNYGQGRIQAVWNYLRFPDGSYINLDRFVTHGADGSVGLRDQTDNHYKRLIGGVLLSAVFAAGIQISQNRNTPNSTLAYPSTGQVVTSAVGQQAGQVGEQIVQKDLNVQPTLKSRPGQIFSVSVMKTIVLPGPYEPINLLQGKR